MNAPSLFGMMKGEGVLYEFVTPCHHAVVTC